MDFAVIIGNETLRTLLEKGQQTASRGAAGRAATAIKVVRRGLVNGIVNTCGAHMSLEDVDDRHLVELLNAVVDLETFLVFLGALAYERKAAEALEAKQPDRFKDEGAIGWKNVTISSFLIGAWAYFTEAEPPLTRAQPDWRDLAWFLYFGKGYES